MWTSGADRAERNIRGYIGGLYNKPSEERLRACSNCILSLNSAGRAGPFESFATNRLSTASGRLAAAQGYAKAQYNLGVMYDNGQGVPQDYAEAVRW